MTVEEFVDRVDDGIAALERIASVLERWEREGKTSGWYGLPIPRSEPEKVR